VKLALLQPRLRAFDNAACRRRIDELLRAARGSLDAGDIVLLPEHALFTLDREEYLRAVRDMAAIAGCAVVGGSHHEQLAGGRVNAGCAVLPDGTVAGAYEKLRPYAQERDAVLPGSLLGEFPLGGLRVMVLICADFWFSDLIQRAALLPDVILVPALSVTRKESPAYSRSLWRQLAVARAYEFGCFVGISDWAHDSDLPRLFASGVGGFADPSGIDPAAFFTPTGDDDLSIHELDLARLAAFREDRRQRGFFWKPSVA
jgi:predicted amidohydrolase